MKNWPDRRGEAVATGSAGRSLKKETRGPVATPAGRVLLPTHREVMTAAFGLPLLGNCPPWGLPRLPCVELRVCIPRRRELEPQYSTDID
jgi:hypothetical protein